ncbi:class II fumarate hydratase [Kangiella sp.]|uniref:class II fumarate hydratase n=1 Tax=Kangiella sp. TaxID=1920245 RepID=UPI0019C9CCD5|nr:class II fumarate hydratase [Kangiella sp.]MBD3654397.1 class II fumarate hydratase [Kangiella sp.]
MGFRIEKDSMGEVKVAEDALYAAQTQRALDNFNISDLKMPLAFIDSILDIKLIAAETNHELGLLPKNKFQAITKAIKKIRKDNLVNHQNFPLDVFQTGSGTSTNMNVNEVVAHLASNSRVTVHPNDDVNMGQSSNDVIPTAISVSATRALIHDLTPALLTLKSTIENKGKLHKKVIKTGRTHLMDAMPLSLQQELSGWAHQIQISIDACQKIVPTIAQLAQGGTAIGTGINSSEKFRSLFARKLKTHTGLPFSKSKNTFASIAGQDASVALSGVLNTLATALMKISNDLRWMNSGPVSGLGEIQLKAIQPGSSIMPGKVNPVIPEAVAMAAAQIMGNNTTITIGAQSGNFQLNVMLPVIAYNLLQSLHLATTSAEHLSETIAHFEVNEKALTDKLDQNAILVTSLAPEIGYENASKIVYKARKEERTILDVAKEMTDLPEAQLKKLLSPKNLI